MKILRYIIPAVILKKVYKNKYASVTKPLSDEEIDALSDMKDDA